MYAHKDFRIVQLISKERTQGVVPRNSHQAKFDFKEHNLFLYLQGWVV